VALSQVLGFVSFSETTNIADSFPAMLDLHFAWRAFMTSIFFKLCLNGTAVHFISKSNAALGCAVTTKSSATFAPDQHELFESQTYQKTRFQVFMTLFCQPLCDEE
jgi:predicted membrane-bound dolichyl-phosphate-mannose-protein mannosyltransferase